MLWADSVEIQIKREDILHCPYHTRRGSASLAEHCAKYELRSAGRGLYRAPFPLRPPWFTQRERKGGGGGVVRPLRKGGGDDTTGKNSMGETDILTGSAFLKLV